MQAVQSGASAGYQMGFALALPAQQASPAMPHLPVASAPRPCCTIPARRSPPALPPAAAWSAVESASLYDAAVQLTAAAMLLTAAAAEAAAEPAVQLTAAGLGWFEVLMSPDPLQGQVHHEHHGVHPAVYAEALHSEVFG